jgi:hypothetical protein
MGGFIILDDGRAYAANNWAYRTTVEAIAAALPNTSEGKVLAEWLRKDPSVQIYNAVDVRELTPANREMFLAASEAAFVQQKERGPSSWAEPDMWPSWIGRFADLVKMIDCVRRGEPPADFNPHMRDVIRPTGDHRGPGWG